MTEFVESGVKLIADASDYTSTLEDALSLAESFDELSPEVTVSADTSALNDLEDSFSDLGGEITPEVAPEVTEEGKSLLTTLHELGINPIGIIMNIGGTILDVLSALNNFTVQPMLDLDDAVAHFNGQTNNAIPNARELFHDILFDDLGDSVDQIGQVATKAAQIGAPIEEATRAALTFTHTFSNEDPTVVLDTLNQLVLNGLAPNFQSAADIITVGFQNGANRSGDLLAALKDNATAFKDLGFTGPQAMSAITTGLDAGFNSATQVAQALEKMKQTVTAAAGNKDADASKTLDFLGIKNPIETGEGWSAEFTQSVIDSIKNAPVSDADKIAMVESLVGTKLGGKEASSLLGLDVLDSPDLFKNVSDRAEQAASDSDHSLRGMIDDFMLAAQEAADDFLSSDAIDLPGKIEALKTGLSDALNVLSEGGSVGDAITVGLKPLGFDDEFQKLESILGNFVIAILDVVASIQDLTGHGDQAAVTRRQIAAQAAQQLPFDLQIANQDEISQVVADAVTHGVAGDDITEAFKTSIGEALDKDNIDRAQQLLNTAKDLAANPQFQIAPGLTGDTASLARTGLAMGQGSEQFNKALEQGLLVHITPDISDEDMKALQDKIDASQLKVKKLGTDPNAALPFVDTEDRPGRGNALNKNDAEQTAAALGDVKTKLDENRQVNLDAATQFTELSTTTTEATTATTAMTSQMGLANLANSDFTTGLYETLAAYEQNTAGLSDQEKAMYISIVQTQALSDATHDFATNAAQAVQIMRDAAGAASSAGDKPTGTAHPGKKAAGGTFKGLSWVGENGPELIGSGKELSVLNNRTSRALMQALSGMPFMQMGGGGMNKNINLTVNNNVQSPSQAMNISYDIGQQVRGF